MSETTMGQFAREVLAEQLEKYGAIDSRADMLALAAVLRDCPAAERAQRCAEAVHLIRAAWAKHPRAGRSVVGKFVRNER